MKTEMKVQGMTCGHCEKSVAAALAAVPGVVRVVAVERERGVAEVEGTANVDALIAALRQAGYAAQAA